MPHTCSCAECVLNLTLQAYSESDSPDIEIEILTYLTKASSFAERPSNAQEDELIRSFHSTLELGKKSSRRPLPSHFGALVQTALADESPTPTIYCNSLAQTIDTFALIVSYG